MPPDLTLPTRYECFRFFDMRRCVEGDQRQDRWHRCQRTLSSGQSSRILPALSLVSSSFGKVRPSGNGRLEKLGTTGPHVPRLLRPHSPVERRPGWDSWPCTVLDLEADVRRPQETRCDLPLTQHLESCT